MMEYIKQVNDVLLDFIWGRGMLIIFLSVGLLFTVRTGFSSSGSGVYGSG